MTKGGSFVSITENNLIKRCQLTATPAGHQAQLRDKWNPGAVDLPAASLPPNNKLRGR